MSKITLGTLGSLQAEQTAIELINANFAKIQTAFENTVSRDGTAPNQLEDDIDLNSNRILNLPAPVGGNDPVRFIDLQSASVSGVVVPALDGNAGKVLSNDGTILLWQATVGGALLASNNLSDVLSASAARTNLGLGTAATAIIGTTGATVPLLNTVNTWSAAQSFTGVTVTGGLTVSGTTEARISSTTLGTISTDSVGYRGIPTTTKDSTYTFLLNDSGWLIRHTSATAHAWTIPPNVFPIGTVIVLRNVGTGAVTITRGGGVLLRLDNSASDANRALGQYGFAVITQEASNTWVITGSGIT